MNKSIGALIAAAALAAFLSSGGVAIAKSGAPLGYQLMCLKHPAECKGGGRSSVAADKSLMQTLKRVNLSVNKAIKPRNDRGADVWSVNATAGDCEDYVLAKRRALIKAGVAPSALRIAHVKTRRGVGHAILVVNTSGGKFVLDNLTSAIKPLSQAGYRLVSMQGANPASWS